MGLLRFIVIVLIIWLMVRFVVRYVLPFLAMFFVKKKQEEFSKQQQDFKSTSRQTHDKEPIGDYVEFEEIKEENS